MTLTLLGLNMVKYLVGTERAKAHACSDTLRQGESPKVSAHGAPGLRARIRPCALQFSLPSADCVVRRTGQRLFARDSPDAPLDMIRAGPALGKHGHTSKCTTQSPDRPLEAAVEALVIAYCFFLRVTGVTPPPSTQEERLMPGNKKTSHLLVPCSHSSTGQRLFSRLF